MGAKRARVRLHQGTLTNFQIQRLEAQVELSEAPLDEESIEFMRARASLSAIVDRSAVGSFTPPHPQKTLLFVLTCVCVV
jgi:hypothetical protein